jgi:hypothetical protein
MRWVINYYFFISDITDKYAVAMIAKAKAAGVSADELPKEIHFYF